MNSLNKIAFHRQRFLLSVLNCIGRPLPKTALQKLLFLACQEEEFGYYDFVPYKYGCYSFQANADIKLLQDRGWLKIVNEKVELAPRASSLFKSDEFGQLISSMQKFRSYSSKKLIAYVYEKHPYYAIHSEIVDETPLTRVARQRIRQEKTRLKNHRKALCTIGYERRSFEEYANILIQNDIRVLCDVRRNPLSRKFGFSKNGMSHRLREIGIAYCHLPNFGIASNKRSSLHSIEDYKKLFATYRRGLSKKNGDFAQVINLLKEYKRVALTCFEREPEYCHRHCISDWLEKNHGVRAKHL